MVFIAGYPMFFCCIAYDLLLLIYCCIPYELFLYSTWLIAAISMSYCFILLRDLLLYCWIPHAFFTVLPLTYCCWFIAVYLMNYFFILATWLIAVICYYHYVLLLYSTWLFALFYMAFGFILHDLSLFCPCISFISSNPCLSWTYILLTKCK